MTHEFRHCWKWLVIIFMIAACSCHSHRTATSTAIAEEAEYRSEATKDTVSAQYKEYKEWAFVADSLNVIVKADCIVTKQGTMYYPEMQISFAKPNKTAKEAVIAIDNQSKSVMTEESGSSSVVTDVKSESASHRDFPLCLRVGAWVALSILCVWLFYRLFHKLKELNANLF